MVSLVTPRHSRAGFFDDFVEAGCSEVVVKVPFFSDGWPDVFFRVLICSLYLVQAISFSISFSEAGQSRPGGNDE